MCVCVSVCVHVCTCLIIIFFFIESKHIREFVLSILNGIF